MKFTFTGQYHLNNAIMNSIVHVSLFMSKTEGNRMMIEDKDIRKTIVSLWNPHNITVHKDFSLEYSNNIVTAEQDRNLRATNPNGGGHGSTWKTQTSKELLCGIYERQLIVDAGTFDKIIKIFNLFPDQVELLFD